MAPGSTLYAVYIINKSGGLVFNRVRFFFLGRPDGRRCDACVLPTRFLLLPLSPQEFAPMASLDVNDTLRFASIWCVVRKKAAPLVFHPSPLYSPSPPPSLSPTHRHSLHAISAQLSPVPGCSGATLLQADTFDLHSFAAPTGTKFLALAAPGARDVGSFLKET